MRVIEFFSDILWTIIAYTILLFILIVSCVKYLIAMEWREK